MITRTDVEIVRDNRVISLKFPFLPPLCSYLPRVLEIFFFPRNVSSLRPLALCQLLVRPLNGPFRTKRIAFTMEFSTENRADNASTATSNESLATELFYRLTGRRSSKSKTNPWQPCFFTAHAGVSAGTKWGSKENRTRPLVFHPSPRGLDYGNGFYLGKLRRRGSVIDPT